MTKGRRMREAITNLITNLPTKCSRGRQPRLCSVVWEKLDQIDGDSEYVDSGFTRSSRCSFASADLPVQLVDSHDK